MPLDCETLSTSTTSTGIGVVEKETFTIETIRKIQFSIHQIEKAFEVGNNPDTIVLETLVHRLGLIVEIHFIAKAGTTAPYYTNAQKVAVVRR